jgi:hypothetical protein
MKNIFSFLFVACAFTCQAQYPVSNWQQLEVRGKVHTLVEYNYDEKDAAGSITKGKLNTITRYLFNQEGALLEEFTTNADSVTLYKIIFSYGNNKLLSGKDIFFKPGPSTIQSRFSYGPDGKLLEELQFRSLTLEFTIQYEYDKAGRVKQKNILNWVDPEQSFKEEFKYDEKGRLIEKYSDRIGLDYRREFYYYDDNGNLVKTGFAKKKAPADVMMEYKFELDTNGNWTSLVEIPSEKKFPNKHIRERVYEYF